MDLNIDQATPYVLTQDAAVHGVESHSVVISVLIEQQKQPGEPPFVLFAQYQFVPF